MKVTFQNYLFWLHNCEALMFQFKVEKLKVQISGNKKHQQKWQGEDL